MLDFTQCIYLLRFTLKTADKGLRGPLILVVCVGDDAVQDCDSVLLSDIL